MTTTPGLEIKKVDWRAVTTANCPRNLQIKIMKENFEEPCQ
jgi:hypothetical protein